MRPSEAVRENHEWAGRLAAGQWLKHHVVSALWCRCAVPGSMERNERTILIGSRKLAALIDHQIVGCPVRGKGGDRRLLLGADPDRLAAVATILGGQHEFLLI